MPEALILRCASCKAILMVDVGQQPADDDFLSCVTCGRPFGAFGEVKHAMALASPAEIDQLIRRSITRK